MCSKNHTKEIHDGQRRAECSFAQQVQLASAAGEEKRIEGHLRRFLTDAKMEKK
jgi:hypothetical protein